MELVVHPDPVSAEETPEDNRIYLTRGYVSLVSDEIEAALAYDKASKALYGEFAWLNFREGSEPVQKTDISESRK